MHRRPYLFDADGQSKAGFGQHTSFAKAHGRHSSSEKDGSKGPGSSSTDSPSSFWLLDLFLDLFPRNPSVGLRFLTPIVPAADNRPALYMVTTAQLLLGLQWMTRRVPRIAESRFRARLASAVRYLAGSSAVLLSGLEYSRLALPYDPWAEEARRWRKWAWKNGHKPSWWFGSIWFYTPMSMAEWKHKTSAWIANTANALEIEENTSLAAFKDTGLLTGISIGPHASLKAGEPHTYEDIYRNLRRINRMRMQTALKEELSNVTELNKAERIDLILEGKGPVHICEKYTKPNITFGNHKMETDEDFEMMWEKFEPWDELGQETDFDVRLIPQS
ncbi:i-AAA protease complex subunit Mgr1 [Metschnikowia bicuspidata]|uniref:I-AAA protease complex subunit Mgr1 n=1 Tax=Metschnikowia bicuspidata TaxID=27322 RepID=A0A4V1J3P2_9ASCO|nr:i-AAA protease complex subunit Mgr1 [Metschnikowia bicuspidata]